MQGGTRLDAAWLADKTSLWSSRLVNTHIVFFKQSTFVYPYICISVYRLVNTHIAFFQTEYIHRILITDTPDGSSAAGGLCLLVHLNIEYKKSGSTLGPSSWRALRPCNRAAVCVFFPQKYWSEFFILFFGWKKLIQIFFRNVCRNSFPVVLTPADLHMIPLLVPAVYLLWLTRTEELSILEVGCSPFSDD